MGSDCVELHERLYEFLREWYNAELMRLSKEEKPALVVDFNELDRFDPIIADHLLEFPETVLAAFQKAIEGFDLPTEEKINVRIRNLPERKQIRIRNLRAEHIGKFIATDIIVKSASEVKPQIYEAVFQCPECDALITVPQDAIILQKPFACDCGRRGEFPLVARKMMDIRWLKGVEPFEITTGEQPSEMAVFLKEDLTTPRMQKKTDPGSRLRITGMLKELPKRIKGKMTTRLDTFLEVNHAETTEIEFEEVEITPEDEQRIMELATDPNIYERLRASLAPGIYGFDEIKDSLVLQLFGGVAHVLPDGNRIRGNIHILITGDPGIGKTMLLKLVSSVVPRGKYVSGKGVTGVGLTASVRKDEVLGGWVLEAGALILCNKGLIAIDEFDKMNKDDQIAMHEATSVETVSIAKASIVATLPAQTAVLAGANPKLGRFDRYRPIAQQLDIPETLLSRFDLKFALMDKPDRSQDERLASHIIASRITPDVVKPDIGINLLRKYIAYAKKINDIQLTKEAADVLEKFYVDMRDLGSAGEIPTVSITLRQFEALLRLAEASAKVRLRREITMDDAERAIRLMRYSLTQLGMDSETGLIDIDRMESGISASQRSRIRVVLDIIDTLQKEFKDKDISVEDIMAEAETQGVEKTEDIIERLKREGMVFEPKPGFLRKIY